MPLPDFIIIGAQKCGTSSLHSYLSEHPDIQMSYEKEVQYFSGGYRWEKGLNWYLNSFPEGPGKKGEASPQYTWYPYLKDSARRMAELVPEVKLIYMVRDPITRIASQYQDWVAQLWERDSFEQVIARILAQPNNRYSVVSRYWYQLQHYLEYFKPEQIKVVAAEDLSRQRAETMRTILEFIGVDADFWSENWNEVAHTGEEKRRPHPIFQYLIGKRLRMELLEPQTIGHRAAYHIREFIQATGRPIERPNPTGELEKQLIDLFRDDVRALREFTGQAFAHWRAY